MIWRRLAGWLSPGRGEARGPGESGEEAGERALRVIRAYHDATKHGFHAYARGPDELDWDTQPAPFRRWAGAETLALAHVAPGAGDDEPRYEEVFVAGRLAARPLDRAFVSRLFLDSLALSAWKRKGDVRWSLRVNPSSGNLHPTEGYLVAPAVPELSATPFVAHYAPQPHALEVRTRFTAELWERLTAGLPEPCALVGLSSIHWREAWKYGERAYRYCNHDVGHALACVALAAAAQGWRATLLDGLGSDEVARLLGLGDTEAPEAEEPDCVLALHPARTACGAERLDAGALAAFGELSWSGVPSELSAGHEEWDAVELAAEAARKPAGAPARGGFEPPWPPLQVGDEPLPFRRIVHGRRSAVAMDGRSGLVRDAFWQTLRRTLPGRGEHPFTALPWRPRVHLALFVHRVADLDPGLYLLIRDPADEEALRADLRAELRWTRPRGCPAELPLWFLLGADVRGLAARVSCHQEIAADGVFSLGMLARFAASLEEDGPWMYPRLFWECGAIGQALYLEAEALGLQATGIGCFFDDAVHAALGLRGHAWQSLYHFTIGGGVPDERIQREPAYRTMQP